MTAEEAAREWLDEYLGDHYGSNFDTLTALILTRERAARVEALRGAADRLRRTGGPWFEGIPDSDRDAAYADWLAARAEEEDRG